MLPLGECTQCLLPPLLFVLLSCPRSGRCVGQLQGRGNGALSTTKMGAGGEDTGIALHNTWRNPPSRESAEEGAQIVYLGFIWRLFGVYLGFYGVQTRASCSEQLCPYSALNPPAAPALTPPALSLSPLAIGPRLSPRPSYWSIHVPGVTPPPHPLAPYWSVSQPRGYGGLGGPIRCAARSCRRPAWRPGSGRRAAAARRRRGRRGRCSPCRRWRGATAAARPGSSSTAACTTSPASWRRCGAGPGSGEASGSGAGAWRGSEEAAPGPGGAWRGLAGPGGACGAASTAGGRHRHCWGAGSRGGELGGVLLGRTLAWEAAKCSCRHGGGARIHGRGAVHNTRSFPLVQEGCSGSCLPPLHARPLRCLGSPAVAQSGHAAPAKSLGAVGTAGSA